MIRRHSPVISYIEQIQSFVEVAYCVWRYVLQEVDVVFCVEATHVVCRCSVRPINLQCKTSRCLPPRKMKSQQRGTKIKNISKSSIPRVTVAQLHEGSMFCVSISDIICFSFI